ncbi:MAG: hypothetical protein KAS84_01090 [Anaerolineales bacterium]|nr:hypothetical protein [Anaerolineales bacterium]
MDSWSLRDEVLRSVNQWYLILAFIIIGGLIGYVITYLVPAPYRATADLFVGIDITRVNEMEYLIPLAKEEPLNLDDYKNWQLKQVADILSSNLVLGDTLEVINAMDSSGKELSLDELKKALDIYWYDTGLWQLEVVLPEEEQALAAVQAWLDTGHGKITELLEVSEQVAHLDAQLQSLNDEIGSLKKQNATLESFLSSLSEWISVLEEFPPDSPLHEDISREFAAWILAYREDDDSWQVPLDNLPLSDQTAANYQSWLGSAQLLANAVSSKTLTQVELLENERAEILPQYHAALEDSLGLSANLVLQPNTSAPSVHQVRSTGIVTLGSGILGLLTWILLAAFRIKGRRIGHD